ncbi:MAG TPA: excinuclease ABC subunit UvrA [Candidatus Saccharimonadales bacterium]|nr:excinuclease ABC subunit UvrA [Candidatus Saccharimonadales bacterium]
MKADKLIIRGAREHNLKNLDLELPKNSLVVITGISGSGKSSLAFDTIYAEGQRRYVESLSAYARQFLGLMEKPDVDQIEGLSPAISIDQKTVSKNPRSTVGTITEIYDYMRLLWARIGVPHCPIDGREIKAQTVQEIVDQIDSELKKSKKDQVNFILAPIIKGRKGIYEEVFRDLKKKGLVRVRVDGRVYEIDEVPSLDRYKIHDIEAVIDRLVTGVDRQRLTETVETALRYGEGLVLVAKEGESGKIFSEKFACPEHGLSLPEIEPRTFSFNSPHGACPSCDGLGVKLTVDPDLVIPSKNLSISEGAIHPWSRMLAHDTWSSRRIEALGHHLGFSLTTAVKDLPKEILEVILYGSDSDKFKVSGRNRFGRNITFNTTFEGLVPELSRRYRETESEWVKREIEKYMREELCELCHGARIRAEALFVTINEKSIVEVANRSIEQTADWFKNLPLSEKEKQISFQVLKEINSRLKFLLDVGLGYLTVNRSSATLAGGEAQRIRLASQIGSGLSGVLYVLDEPTIGLHSKDNDRLIKTLMELKELGNTVIVVEHDREVMERADYLVDIGPGAGELGGEIIAEGTPEIVANTKASLTGQFLKGTKVVGLSTKDFKRIENKNKLTIKKASEHNLKNIDVEIPLGKFIAVTGVSGSGKSTLVGDILKKALSNKLYSSKEKPGKYGEISGIEHIDKVVDIDQSPIGRTPRSNPATYTGAFTNIRDIFANTPDARARGYSSGRFSFNVKGGRCETCQGDGVIKIEMQFLPDVYVTCETCLGKRYNREALEITYKGKNIAEILEMTIQVASKFFENIPNIKAKLQTLNDVGLGYMKLGQGATTLSGGEAQRVKLATELSRRSTGKTFYILDEPTTGLHFADIENLLKVLHRLVELGNTVLVIEHNLDVIKTADWIIDLGPEGGDKGGELVAEGSVEQIINNKKSATGTYLAKVI